MVGRFLVSTGFAVALAPILLFLDPTQWRVRLFALLCGLTCAVLLPCFHASCAQRAHEPCKSTGKEAHTRADEVDMALVRRIGSAILGAFYGAAAYALLVLYACALHAEGMLSWGLSLRLLAAMAAAATVLGALVGAALKPAR
jgi:hypothetical protein